MSLNKTRQLINELIDSGEYDRPIAKHLALTPDAIDRLCLEYVDTIVKPLDISECFTENGRII